MNNINNAIVRRTIRQLKWDIRAGARDNITSHVLSLRSMNKQIPKKLLKELLIYIANPSPLYLDNPKNNDEIEVIRIVLSSLKFNSGTFRIILHGTTENNPMIWIDILFEIKCKFDYRMLRHINNVGYKNSRIESSVDINEEMIYYIVATCCFNWRSNTTYFSHIIPLIKHVPFNLVVLGIKICRRKNGASRKFINTLVTNIIDSEYGLLSDYFMVNKMKDKNILYAHAQNKLCTAKFIEYACNYGILKDNLQFLKLYDNINTNLINMLIKHSEYGTYNMSSDANFEEKQVVTKYAFKKVNPKHVKLSKIVFNVDSGELICAQNNGITKYFVRFIELFGIFGCKPNNETFKMCLEKNYEYSVDVLINRYNMIPSKSHLNMVLKKRKPSIKLIATLLCYKLMPNLMTLQNFIDAQCFDYNNYSKSDYFRVNTKNTGSRKKYRSRIRGGRRTRCRARMMKKNDAYSIIDLLINNGLTIDLKVISMLLSCGMHLENLENFGIAYDENLFFECYLNGFYPIEYVNKFTIDKDVLNMRLSRNIKDVCAYAKNNNSQLDGYMIDMMIEQKNTEMVSKYCAQLPLLTIFKIMNHDDTICRGFREPIIDNDVILMRKKLKSYVSEHKITSDVMTKQFNIHC